MAEEQEPKLALLMGDAVHRVEDAGESSKTQRAQRAARSPAKQSRAGETVVGSMFAAEESPSSSTEENDDDEEVELFFDFSKKPAASLAHPTPPPTEHQTASAKQSDTGSAGGSVFTDDFFGIEYRPVRRTGRSASKLPSGPSFADEKDFEKDVSQSVVQSFVKSSMKKGEVAEEAGDEEDEFSFGAPEPASSASKKTLSITALKAKQQAKRRKEEEERQKIISDLKNQPLDTQREEAAPVTHETLGEPAFIAKPSNAIAELRKQMKKQEEEKQAAEFKAMEDRVEQSSQQLRSQGLGTLNEIQESQDEEDEEEDEEEAEENQESLGDEVEPRRATEEGTEASGHALPGAEKQAADSLNDEADEFGTDTQPHSTGSHRAKSSPQPPLSSPPPPPPFQGAAVAGSTGAGTPSTGDSASSPMSPQKPSTPKPRQPPVPQSDLYLSEPKVSSLEQKTVEEQTHSDLPSDTPEEPLSPTKGSKEDDWVPFPQAQEELIVLGRRVQEAVTVAAPDPSGGCCAGWKKTSLSGDLAVERELIFRIAKLPYASDEPRIQIMHTLLHELTGTERKPSQVSPMWQRIGFQSDDFTRDLRGLGMLGPLNALYLCQRFPRLATDIYTLSIDEVHNFPFMVTSFNFSLFALQTLRFGRLNKYIKQTGSAFEAFHELYCAMFFEFFCSYEEKGGTIATIYKYRDSVKDTVGRSPVKWISKFFYAIDTLYGEGQPPPSSPSPISREATPSPWDLQGEGGAEPEHSDGENERAEGTEVVYAIDDSDEDNTEGQQRKPQQREAGEFGEFSAI